MERAKSGENQRAKSGENQSKEGKDEGFKEKKESEESNKGLKRKLDDCSEDSQQDDDTKKENGQVTKELGKFKKAKNVCTPSFLFLVFYCLFLLFLSFLPKPRVYRK